MRIIAGRLKGGRLASVPGLHTRPTADRVREALFNILGSVPKGAAVLDLYAGTGALGIEALSRGSRSAVFVDHAQHVTAILHKNLQKCGMQAYARVIRWDIARNLNCLKGYVNTFELVFIDPPYRCQMVRPTLMNLTQVQCLANDALIVAEHDPDESIEPLPLPLGLEDQRRYGKTLLSLLRPQDTKTEPWDRVTRPIYRWTPE